MTGQNLHNVTLEAKGLKIGYRLKASGEYVVHNDLSLSLMQGEVTCLMGLNGAGKSTLLRTLCGFQPPLSGEVKLLGRDVASYSQREMSRTIGVVLTEKTNAGGITVRELVSLGRHPYTGFFGSLSAEDHAIVEESLVAAGISHKSRSYVSELSDGERQKAMIARALAQQCPIIILDEPTAFLDVTSRIETMILLRRLAREQGKTILLSTHDLDMAIQMADSIWLLKRGAPLYAGAPEDLILNKQLSNFFNRDQITFDISTGKLNTLLPQRIIALSGDPLVSHWLSNALLRVGYQGVSADQLSDVDGVMQILCHGVGRLELRKGGKSAEAQSIAELLTLISNR